MALEKKLVEDISGWLQLFDDGSVNRSWVGPPEARFMAEPVPPHEEFIDRVSTRDLIINEKSGLMVRIYQPELPKGTGKVPIVLHFHGGGFCISRPDWFMYYNVYTNLARSVPAICISVYMRLAPEHRLPASIDDAFSAVEWLDSVARGEFVEPWVGNHGDFDRVFLVGDSAGGNAVHEVAARVGSRYAEKNHGFVRAGEVGAIWVRGGVLIHPGFLRSGRSRSELEQPETPFLTLAMVDKCWKLALPVGATRDHPITCPMGEDAPPMDGLEVPPFLLCLAEKDLHWDTEMEYYEAMKKGGKDVELFVSRGMSHCFYLNKLAVDSDSEIAAEAERLMSAIVEFIKKH